MKASGEMLLSKTSDLHQITGDRDAETPQRSSLQGGKERYRGLETSIRFLKFFRTNNPQAGHRMVYGSNKDHKAEHNAEYYNQLRLRVLIGRQTGSVQELTVIEGIILQKRKGDHRTRAFLTLAIMVL